MTATAPALYVIHSMFGTAHSRCYEYELIATTCGTTFRVMLHIDASHAPQSSGRVEQLTSTGWHELSEQMGREWADDAPQTMRAAQEAWCRQTASEMVKRAYWILHGVTDGTRI